MKNYKFEVVPIEKLKPDPNQPRKYIDEEYIKELAISIKNEGIVNEIETDKNFIIITGEMRWRAARSIGIKELSVKIIDKIGKTKNSEYVRTSEVIYNNIIRYNGYTIDKYTTGKEILIPANSINGIEVYYDESKIPDQYKNKDNIEHTPFGFEID